MLSELSRGDFPANLPEKPGYRLEFSDEFGGPDLDRSKWVPCYLPQWSSCEQAAANYRFEDGSLLLQIIRNQPAWCPEFDGPNRASVIQTGVFSGPVGSRIGQSRFSDKLVVREAQANAREYTPQFGYFETRVKGLATSANHVSLWMIGYEDAPEHSAEICMFELLGKEAGAHESTVRYGVHRWSDPQIQEEFYVENFPIDSTRFHIYAVEWTPTHIDFFIDNTKIKTIRQSPQYPMQFMLGLFELPYAEAWNGPYNPDDLYPKTFTVDYLRGYQPVGGYRLLPGSAQPTRQTLKPRWGSKSPEGTWTLAVDFNRRHKPNKCITRARYNRL